MLEEVEAQLNCNVSDKEICLKHKLSHIVVVVVLLFYVHGKHLVSYRDGQLT